MLSSCEIGSAALPTVWKKTPAIQPNVKTESQISMTDYAENLGRLWSIVLAGGEGARMHAWIQTVFGVLDSTQLDLLRRNRSMFQLTLDRARQIAPDGEIVAITTRDFEQISKIQIEKRRVDLLVQPANRGTTGTIYYALSHIMSRDPRAHVVIFPSDHFVEPEATFVTSIRRAINLSALIPDKLMLIATTPDKEESDYGYVLPRAKIASYGGNQLSSVTSYLEKPRVREISSIQKAGGLWSTSIIVSTAQTFFDAGATCIPGILDAFYHYQQTIGGCQEKVAQACLSQNIASSDFSKDVLRNVPHHLAMYQLNNVHWSDRGRKERVVKNGANLNANDEP